MSNLVVYRPIPRRDVEEIYQRPDEEGEERRAWRGGRIILIITNIGPQDGRSILLPRMIFIRHAAHGAIHALVEKDNVVLDREAGELAFLVGGDSFDAFFFHGTGNPLAVAAIMSREFQPVVFVKVEDYLL